MGVSAPRVLFTDNTVWETTLLLGISASPVYDSTSEKWEEHFIAVDSGRNPSSPCVSTYTDMGAGLTTASEGHMSPIALLNSHMTLVGCEDTSLGGNAV